MILFKSKVASGFIFNLSGVNHWLLCLCVVSVLWLLAWLPVAAQQNPCELDSSSQACINQSNPTTPEQVRDALNSAPRSTTRQVEALEDAIPVSSPQAVDQNTDGPSVQGGAQANPGSVPAPQQVNPNVVPAPQQGNPNVVPAPQQGNPNRPVGGGVVLQNPLSSISTIPDLIAAILRIIIIIAIPVIIIFLILAGFKFVLARGNPNEIQEARQALLYALIGAVLILGSVAITQILANLVNSFR